MASIDQINTFIKVYELQGYSAAARELGKSRTTVRELILTFEESLQLVLFNIEGRQAKATKNAHRLYPHAQLLQAQLIKFSGLTDSLLASPESKIILYYDAMLPTAFMVDLTASLHKKFPEIELDWRLEEQGESFKTVSENVTSISFLMSKNRDFSDPRVETYFLGFNDFAIFSGANSNLVDIDVINQIDLQNTVQLIPRSMLAKGINGYTRFSSNAITVNNNDEVCRLLEQIGWAILPKKDVAPYVERGLIVQIVPHFMFKDLKMSMAAYYKPAINRGPAMHYLLSQLLPLSNKHFN